LADFNQNTEIVKSSENPSTTNFMKVLSEVLQFFREDRWTDSHGEKS